LMMALGFFLMLTAAEGFGGVRGLILGRTD
jgi:hypothetical protein